jgi:hypothetical protein
LHQIGFNPLFFKFAENVMDQDRCIPVLPWATVKRNDLHFVLLLEKDWKKHVPGSDQAPGKNRG